jgi:hypothetical protein
MKDVIRASIAAQVGQLSNAEFGKLSLEDVLRQATGLTFRSPFYLLRKRFANLSDDDPSLTWMELAETLKRKMLLEDVLRDERFRYELREDEKRTGQEFNRWVRVGEPAPERRSFHFPGNPDMRWFWIDFEQEWP